MPSMPVLSLAILVLVSLLLEEVIVVGRGPR